jgi:outer membrane protein TolC
MAAGAFFRLYETDRKLEVARETRSLLEDFQEVARSMYAAGTGRQSDVLRANVEVARMDAEIERMKAMRRVAAARLNAVLDRPADTPVPEVVLPALPADWPARDTLRSWAEQSRPLLQRSRTGVERAETGQALAHRQIWPDFSIGLQYGQRDAGPLGTARMGSAMIGFSIPVFAGRKQMRMRDEAAAMESMAQAELEADRANVDARVGELLAELDRARTLLDLYRDDVLPQADANVESSFSSYRVGAVDFPTLVDAQMTTNRYEQEYFTLLADYGRAVAELETTVGRELPATTQRMAEAR